MSPRKPVTPGQLPKAPSRARLRDARLALEELELEGYASSGFVRVLDLNGAGSAQDRLLFAQACLRTYADDTPLGLEGHPFDEGYDEEADLPRQVMTLVVLLVGAEEAARLVWHELNQAASGQAEAWLLAAAARAGLEFLTDDAPLALLPEEVEGLVADLDEGEVGEDAIASTLLLAPQPLRRQLLEALLASPHPRLPAFIAKARFGAFDPDTQATFGSWLEDRAPALAAWASARQANRPALLPAEGAPSLPLDWPVREAYASMPDGCGSQGFYLVRERPDGDLALATVVVNDWRGVADASAHPQLSEEELGLLLGPLARAKLVQVPAGYVRARLNDGVALAVRRGLPLPMLLLVHWQLYQGIEPLSLDLAAEAACWAGPQAELEALGETWTLADAEFFASWFEPGTRPALAGLFASTRAARGDQQATDEAIEDALPGYFTDEERSRWAGRLVQVAYLAGLDGQVQLRELAARAAVALTPESGVELADQPVAWQILDLSLRHATGSGDMTMGPRRSLLPPGLDEAQARVGALAPATKPRGRKGKGG